MYQSWNLNDRENYKNELIMRARSVYWMEGQPKSKDGRRSAYKIPPKMLEHVYCEIFGFQNVTTKNHIIDGYKKLDLVSQFNKAVALKTFTLTCTLSPKKPHKSPKYKYEKVGEFGRFKDSYINLSGLEKATQLSALYNDRIHHAETKYHLDLNHLIYHCVAIDQFRAEAYIFEYPLHLINLEHLSVSLNPRRDKKGLYFTDGEVDFKFDASKNTIMRKFIFNNPVDQFMLGQIVKSETIAGMCGYLLSPAI